MTLSSSHQVWSCGHRLMWGGTAQILALGPLRVLKLMVVVERGNRRISNTITYVHTLYIYIFFSVTHVCVFSDVGIPAIVPKVWVFLRKGQFRDQSNASWFYSCGRAWFPFTSRQQQVHAGANIGFLIEIWKFLDGQRWQWSFDGLRWALNLLQEY